jgi:hypothetical protein
MNFYGRTPDGFAALAWSMLPVATALLAHGTQVPANMRVT